MSVNYKQCDGKKTIETHFHSACFSTIFSGYTNKETTEIVVYVEEPNFAIPLEMIPRWIEAINQLGFPCEYLGKGAIEKYEIEAKYHNFVVDVTKYKSQNHLCSTLTLLRYMFESGYRGCYAERGIVAFFAIQEQIKGIDPWEALLMSFCYFEGTNHTCHRTTYRRKFLTKEKVFETFPKEGGVYDGEHSNIFSCWDQGENINFMLPNTYTELYALMGGKIKTKVYVVGTAKNYASWLPDTILVDKMEEADVVMFTGGEDVHPSLYGEPVGAKTEANLQRDLREQKEYKKAKKLGKRCLGICRGSQFLCVMNGGKLVQDQPGAGYVHTIHTKDYEDIEITSTHHQAAFPYNLKAYDYSILGWTNKLLAHHHDGKGKELAPKKECEIVYYRTGNDLGIQGHPEYEDYRDNPKYTPSMNALKDLYKNFINDKL